MRFSDLTPSADIPLHFLASVARLFSCDTRGANHRTLRWVLHLLVVVLIALRLCSDVFADVIYRFANELTASTKGGRENIGVRLDALVVSG